MSTKPLNHYRDSVVAYLQTVLPPLVDVDTHHGKLDAGEVARVAMASPALRVAALGVDGLENRGGARAVMSFGVFVITGVGKKGESPDEAALALVATVLAAIAGQNFGCDAAAPSSVRAENYSSGEMIANNTCLWAVTWKTSLDVENVIAGPKLDDFLRCYVREKPASPATVEIHLPASGVEPALEGV